MGAIYRSKNYISLRIKKNGLTYTLFYLLIYLIPMCGSFNARILRIYLKFNNLNSFTNYYLYTYVRDIRRCNLKIGNEGCYKFYYKMLCTVKVTSLHNHLDD